MGFIVWREGPHPSVPFRAGDDVVFYELESDEWPWADLPPHSGHDQRLLDYQSGVFAYANSDDDWRLQSELKCDCRQGRVIAQLLVHSKSARIWAVAKPERVPTAFRKDEGGRGVQGWALHGRAGEEPHVGGVSSCKGCGTRWLIVSFVDRIESLRILGATHGAKVAP